MDHILQGLLFVIFYLNEVVVFSKTVEKHLDHGQQVIDRIAKHCLKIEMKKCFFVQTQVKLLGHIINKESVRTDPEKIEAIQKIPVSRSVKEIPSFLGMAGYYR